MVIFPIPNLRYKGYCLEPSILQGVGTFVIESVKDIKATSSYYGLGENVIGCSDEEPYFDCTSRIFKQEASQNCDCLPSSINFNSEVDLL